MNKVLGIFAALTLAGLPQLASAADWSVDSAHSEISWAVDHMVISETVGEFKSFDLTIKDFDGKDASKTKISVTIKTASIDSDEMDRDKHLKGPDFLDAKKYPEATFNSKKVTSTGGNKYDVVGDFTLHGVTKEITIPMVFRGVVKDPWGNTKAGFKGALTIDRNDYGLVWSKSLDAGGLVVGNDVTLTFNIEVKQN